MNIENLLIVAAALFCIGIYGFLTSQNVVRILMSLELLLNAININLVTFSTYMDSLELKGQVFALFVITIAAAESAIALAILLSIYRNKESIAMEQFNLLKW
jgi:NAD(P)H-quinone oxidoreductase subunit 4L